MHNFRLTAFVLVTLASGAAAEQLPPGIGVNSPSGSVFTSTIGPGTRGPLADTDDYVFAGYPGMTLTAVVRPTKGSTLEPELVIQRSDGSVVTDDDGLQVVQTRKSITARVTLDATGWWKVRVRGAPVSIDTTVFPNEVTRSSGEYQVLVKYTAPRPAISPAASKSFTASGAIAFPGDVDVVRFQGYEGQTFDARLVARKSSALDPRVTLVRPNGSVFEAQGAGNTDKRLAFSELVLDGSGQWRIEVRGEEPPGGDPNDHTDQTVGPYSLTVRLGRTAAPGLRPDANGEYVLRVPGTGRATIGYRLTFTGAAPSFRSFVDPFGKPVSGFPAATSVSAFLLPANLPQGDYTLTFATPAGEAPTNVSFTRVLKLPRAERKRVSRLDVTEPVILHNGIHPAFGGPGNRGRGERREGARPQRGRRRGR